MSTTSIMKILASLLSTSLILTTGGGGVVFGFSSPSSVKSIHIKAVSSSHHHSPTDSLIAFTSSNVRLQNSLSPLKFTPKDDNEASSDKPFIRPALHNSNFFRALSILYALLFAVYTTSKSPSTATNALSKIGKHLILSSKAAATVHILSFGTWFGTVFYTTFIAGITMFKNLPRRTFGTIQSKLFPLYFQLCTGMVALQVSFYFAFTLFKFDHYLTYCSLTFTLHGPLMFAST